MELNDFIEKFAELFEDTDKSEFTADTYFRELDEWSSFKGASIISMVDDEFDVIITGDDLRAVDTVEDLYIFVKSKK